MECENCHKDVKALWNTRERKEVCFECVRDLYFNPCKYKETKLKEEDLDE